MQIETVKVTPTLAKKWLESNVNNRRIREATVNSYAAEMKAGRWREGTAETIKFDRNKRLQDGQHRLLAIIKSNCSYRFSVATNCDPENFKVIDQGSTRSISDVMQIEGIAQSTQLSAGIKYFHSLVNNKTDINGGSKKVGFTSSIGIEIYRKEPDFWNNSNHTVISWYRNFSKILSPSFLLGNYAFLKKTSSHKDRVDQFFDLLCAKMGDPVSTASINLLRNALFEDARSTRKMNNFMKQQYFNTVWNAYVSGKPMRRLSYNPDNGRVVSL